MSNSNNNFINSLNSLKSLGKTEIKKLSYKDIKADPKLIKDKNIYFNYDFNTKPVSHKSNITGKELKAIMKNNPNITITVLI